MAGFCFYSCIIFLSEYSKKVWQVRNLYRKTTYICTRKQDGLAANNNKTTKTMNATQLTPGTLCQITGCRDIYVVIASRAKTTVIKPLTDIYGRNKPTDTVKNGYLQEYIPVALTTENAACVSLVYNHQNPEWGIKRFNYDSGGFHTHGTGSNQALLFASEFHLWNVVATK